MQTEVFISHSINDSINNYINYKEKEYTKEFNSFECSIFRMLLIIYGEELLTAYNEKNPDKFDKIIMKYGLEVEKLDEFKINFEKYYKMKKQHEDKAIKKKNKFFNLVQKNIIDMMIEKNKKEQVNKDNLEDFYNLLFTANSNNFYKKSIAVLEAYNPYEIDNYAKKHLMGVEVNENNKN